MRECGSCTACCTWLIGDAYGHSFGNGKSCKFLSGDGCSVYKARPKCCEKYYCAWAQELIDDTLKPDESGVLVSVENNENGQYLKVLEIKENTLNNNIISYFKEWERKMNTPVIIINDKL